MGIVAALREDVIPLFIYLLLFAGVIAGIVWRAEIPVILLAIFMPLPTIWYTTHAYPFGKDAIDLLFISSAIGVSVNKGGYKKTPLFALVIATVIYTYISLIICSSRFGLPPPISLDNPFLAGWKNYVLMLFIYLVAYNATTSEKQVKWVINTCIGVLIFMVYQELRSFTAGASFSYGKRSDGPFWIAGLNANHFAAYVAYIGIFSLGLAIFATAKRGRWVYALTFIGSLYPLLFSYSRGAYGAMLGAITLYGLIKKRSIILLVLLFLVSWQSLLPTSVIERIEMTESESGNLEESASQRIAVWNEAVSIFQNHTITGIGYSGFVVATQSLVLHDTHNYYLKIAAEQGIVGLGLWLAFILSIALNAWRLTRSGKTPQSKGIGFSTLGCITAVMICNFFGDRFSQIEIGGTLMLIFAMTQRQAQLDKLNSPMHS